MLEAPNLNISHSKSCVNFFVSGPCKKSSQRALPELYLAPFSSLYQQVLCLLSGNALAHSKGLWCS